MPKYTLNDWIAALHEHDCDPKKSGSSYKARCPAHTDKNPSLSLYQNDKGEWWPTCHTGCNWRDIMKVLNLWNEPKANGTSKSEIPDRDPDFTFDYLNVDGTLSFQVLRWNPAAGQPKKVIRPRLPNGVGKLPQGQRVLYNRPDFKSRPEAGVLYVEGEKTAVSAAVLVPERIVTTSAGGPDQVGWKPLAGRDVIIWPDHDEAGIKKARKVRAILKEMPDTKIRIVDLKDSGLPTKWDLADPLPEGLSLQEISKHFIPDVDLDELDEAEIEVATGGKPVFDDANASSVAAAMETLGLEIKSNTRDMTVTYKLPCGKWSTDGSSVIRNEIRERCLLNGKAEGYRPFKMSDSDWRVSRDTLAQRNSYDPFITMLEALPAPPDEDQYASVTLLHDHFGLVYPEERPLASWAVRFIVLGQIQRAFQPGSQLDETPILVGEQDAGKSKFLESFFAPEHRDLFREGLDLAATDKAKVEALQGASLVELGEMSGVTKARLEHLKAFLTRKNDGNVRLSYRTDPTPMYRKCIFVGTANNKNFQLPEDPSGQRRFVPITLGTPTKAIEPVMAELRDSLWAEGLARYRAGERANLPRELKELAADAAQRYRSRNQYLEDNIANLGNRYNDTDNGLTLREIADRLNLGDKSRTGKELPASLKNEGWHEMRSRREGKQLRLWFPPEQVSQSQLA